MTITEKITVECFMERVEHFIWEYEKLQKDGNENYIAYESRVFDLIAELNRDIEENRKEA